MSILSCMSICIGLYVYKLIFECIFNWKVMTYGPHKLSESQDFFKLPVWSDQQRKSSVSLQWEIWATLCNLRHCNLQIYDVFQLINNWNNYKKWMHLIFYWKTNPFSTISNSLFKHVISNSLCLYVWAEVVVINCRCLLGLSHKFILYLAHVKITWNMTYCDVLDD